MTRSTAEMAERGYFEVNLMSWLETLFLEIVYVEIVRIQISIFMVNPDIFQGAAINTRVATPE